MLLKSFLTREIRDRYLGSIGGLLWVFLLPLALLGIYAFVFVHILKARIPEADLVGFVPFLAIAFWPWIAFSEGLLRGATAITENATLIGKVALPHEILVLASAGAAYLLNILGYVGVLVVLALTGTSLHFSYIPVAFGYLVLLCLFMLGCAYLISATQVYIRDLAHALNPLLTLWFFTTPVLYSSDLIPQRFQAILAFNPMAYFVERLRVSLLFGTWSPHWSDLLAIVLIILFVYLARAYFLRLSKRFEDFL